MIIRSICNPENFLVELLYNRFDMTWNWFRDDIDNIHIHWCVNDF